MERLTEIVVDSFGKTRAVLIEPTKWSACANCNSRNNCDDCSLQKAVSKLSTIEDILGDDCDLDRLRVIVNQRMSMRDEVAKRFEITKNIPLDRLRELVEAGRGGRCVVLPVEVGQNVYFINRAFDSEICTAIVIGAEINLYTPSCPIWLRIEWFSKRTGKHEYYSRADLMIGKTVFLTCEEAEAALEEMKNG